MRNFNWGSDGNNAIFIGNAHEFANRLIPGEFLSADKLSNYGGENHQFGPNLPFEIYKGQDRVYAVQNKPFSKGSYGRVSLAVDDKQRRWVFKRQRVKGVITTEKNGVKTDKSFNHEEEIKNEISVINKLCLGESQWIGEDDGFENILIEPYFGPDLETYLQNLKLEELSAGADKNSYYDLLRLNLALDICKAVLELHAKEYAHLDIKPKNITVDAEGKIHLIDFGFTQSLNFKFTNNPVFGTQYYLIPLKDRQAYAKVAAKKFDLFAVLRTINMPLKPLILEKFDKENLARNKEHNRDPNYRELLSDDFLKNFPELKKCFDFTTHVESSGHSYVDPESLTSIEALCAEISLVRSSLDQSVDKREDLDRFVAEMANKHFKEGLASCSEASVMFDDRFKDHARINELPQNIRDHFQLALKFLGSSKKKWETLFDDNKKLSIIESIHTLFANPFVVKNEQEKKPCSQKTVPAALLVHGKQRSNSKKCTAVRIAQIDGCEVVIVPASVKVTACC